MTQKLSTKNCRRKSDDISLTRCDYDCPLWDLIDNGE